MPDQLVRQRARHAREVEAHRAVLEHREVPDLEDVPQVARVRCRDRVRLGPRLVAGAPGELGERLAAVGVGLPGHVRRREELGLRDELDPQRHGLRHGRKPYDRPRTARTRAPRIIGAQHPGAQHRWLSRMRRWSRPRSPTRYDNRVEHLRPAPVRRRAGALPDDGRPGAGRGGRPVDAAGIVPGARVADVGCGPGAMLVSARRGRGARPATSSGSTPTPPRWPPPAPRSPRPGCAASVAPGAVRHGRAQSHGAAARIGRHGRAAARARPQRPGRSSGSSTTSRRSCAPAATSTSLDVDLTTATVTPTPPDAVDLHDALPCAGTSTRATTPHRTPAARPRPGSRARHRRVPQVDRRGSGAARHARAGVGGPRRTGRAPGSPTRPTSARWDAAFAALDAATERPEFALGVFAAVCRRPA